MKKLLILPVLALALLFSCAKEQSQNVNQDSIYSIYELFYNQENDISTARATFRFGGPTGTLLQLNDPAKVTFEGDELLYKAATGVHKKEYAGFANSGTFVYKDLDSNTFTNATTILDTIAFPMIDTISNAGAFTFTWVGNPIAANETVTLTIDGTQQNNFEVFTTIVNGNTQLILPANKLQNLGVGTATCTLMRAYNKASVDQGTSKGGRVAYWYTTKKDIFISN